MAFSDTLALPAAVFGPVDFLAFSRFALRRCSLTGAFLVVLGGTAAGELSGVVFLGLIPSSG